VGLVGERKRGAAAVGLLVFGFYSGHDGHDGGRHQEGGEEGEEKFLLFVVGFLREGNVVAGIGDSGVGKFWVGHGLL